MPVKIFFCYAHEDEALLRKLKVQLKPFQRQGLIDVWHDRDISAGTEWEKEITEYLNNAQVILLLVSPDFMDSDYCYGIEMKRALERHKKGEARVIPVILRPVHWQDILGNIQALPIGGNPVTSSIWHSPDDAFFNVAEGIQTVIKEISKQFKQQCMKLLNQARQQVQMQNIPAALNSIDNVLKIAPDYIDALILKAQLLGSTGYFQEALVIAKQLVEVDSSNALGWSICATLLANMGQFHEASDAIERSLYLNPNDPEALAIRSTIQTNLA